MIQQRDLKILSALRTNARVKLSDISKATRVPISTIWDRLREYEGKVIRGHITLLDFSRLGFATRAQVLIKTDMRCRMLDESLEPIAGIYAAGELCGMAGGHINGKAGLEGTMLGPSIFSGRVAGAWAAQEAGFGAGFQGTANRKKRPVKA